MTSPPDLCLVFTARSEQRKVPFLAQSVCGLFLFVYEIYQEPLNGFAPNSQGRRVWSLARSLKVNVKGQRPRSPGTKTSFSALSAASVRFMFGKTSLASSLCLYRVINSIFRLIIIDA